MALPTADEYRTALAYYRDRSLQADPELAGGLLEMQPGSRFPVMRSGAYAIVYTIRSKSARYALRVFTRQVDDIVERYEAIVCFLEKKRDDLPFVILPEFRKGRAGDGIFVAGNWYPYLKRPWIQALSLRDWVCQRVERSDSAALRELAKRWTEVVQSLKKAGVAHGDLQPGNILVDKKGAIHLIDLDGMFVPGLAGRRSVGVGLPSYQHPGRRAEHFDPHLDDFSALLITVSLLALAESPSLYKRPLGDNDLLFTANDIRNPEDSKLFGQLTATADSEVVRLTEILRDASLGPYGEVPCFDEVADVTALQEAAFSELMAACVQEDDAKIVSIWDDGALLGSYGPCACPAIQGRVKLAQARMARLSKLVKAIDDDDDLRIAKASDALERFGGLSSLTEDHQHRVGAAKRRLHLLERLREAYGVSDDETLRRWRPDVLMTSKLFTPRDRVRVFVALRAVKMEQEVREAIAKGDYLALALVHDSYLAARRRPSCPEEMAQIGLGLDMVAGAKQEWIDTLLQKHAHV